MKIYLIILVIFCYTKLTICKPEKCILSKDIGKSCEKKDPTKRYYFDKNSGVCQFFMFQGCEGNENNFESLAECKSVCGQGKEDQTWVLADKCESNFLIPNGNYIECTSQGCPKNHTCNIKTNTCCPDKDYLCTLEDDSGNFGDGIPDKPRFAWSDSINSCVRFSYYGVNGNYNNFPNFQSCVKYCKNYKEEKETIDDIEKEIRKM
uniref:BPTI/Kunitz inhibitor domain-containing protein n=1 Tax=Parastrongyloides trichosuri TaxID=131310 RepID=A0A0N4ZPZ2_PARTI